MGRRTTKPANRAKARPARNTRGWIIGGVIGIIVIVALLVWSQQGSVAQAPAAPGGTAGADVLARCGGPVCGNSTARVTVEIFSDFQ